MTLSVAAHGAGNLSYQWFFEGKAIAGATKPALTIKKARADDEGDYAVVIRNSKESITSESVFVDIKGSSPRPGPGPRR